MIEATFWSALAILAAAAATAFAALWTVARYGASSARKMQPKTSKSTRFLFQKDKLRDQERPLEVLPATHSGNVEHWTDLRTWLGERFGPLPATLTEIKNGEALDFPSVTSEDEAVLTLSGHRGLQRVFLSDPALPDACALHRFRGLDSTLARFLGVLEKAPCAVRVYEPNRGIVWQNQLFNQFTDSEVEQIIHAATSMPALDRVCLPGEHAGQDRHFEITSMDVGEVNTVYVTDVTQVAKAETVRREFIQTLTKTFANLTTGLAVFDRHRQLALFNPALLDLTNLPAAFLSSRPPMTQFFDKLRDNKILPEPKNYGTWRSQIDTMITSASDGLYFEDWHLPNDCTYRVTGRPHPDGAIAFLFEDISDEVALTRRYRGQIDIRQAALDASDQAMAIIGSNNVVLLCNAPCSDLLGIDPDASFAEMSAADFLAVCAAKLPEDGFWERAETRIAGRVSAKTVLQDRSGQEFRCAIKPLRRNTVMISFSAVASAEQKSPLANVS